MANIAVQNWVKKVVRQDEIDKYLINGQDFINAELIERKLMDNKQPAKQQVRDILQKSMQIERLSPDETATLLRVEDEALWQEMYFTGLEIKKKVYDNRIVFFAPLYMSNFCVNNCAYCGFRNENKSEQRRVLTPAEIKSETAAMVSEGHKRMIAVYGEHPRTDVNYMCQSMEAVYSVKQPAPRGPGHGQIRRVNVNAPPMTIQDLKKLWQVGIGTYQVFQETYHKSTYRRMHPENTIKGNYQWRLYALHRAMEAGVDDVAIGALFGLYDWRFEVMGLLYHAIDLEHQFNIGPHTVSFPRLMHASGSEVAENSPYLVNDDEFKKLVTVIRLAIPYTGLIITNRERAELKKDVMRVGCTQTDASTCIGVGGYTTALKNRLKAFYAEQDEGRQQFMLGDTRRLDEEVREFAEMGWITSFCTAGYRCGRTGDKIMGLLKNCVEGKFCKLNAVLTFREYLDDYASDETRRIGEQLIQQEMQEIHAMAFFQERPKLLQTFNELHQRILNGERDVYI